MKKSLNGKTVLITGATDGLGKLVATHLAEKDTQLLLHGRNAKKGQALLTELKNKTANEQLFYYNADFFSLDEVHSMSRKILKEQTSIDILINNAGSYSNVREKNHCGLELTMTVNYFAHVLLTEKLLPTITENAGKIINVASASQMPIDFSDLMMEKSYEMYKAYCKSKTALIMYTLDLAQRLEEKGIVVNALHPASLMNTKMVPERSQISSVEDGASALESLLNVETTGKFYNGKRLSKAIPQVYNIEDRKKLRQATSDILNQYLYL